jgi:hypothetical protein
VPRRNPFRIVTCYRQLESYRPRTPRYLVRARISCVFSRPPALLSSASPGLATHPRVLLASGRPGPSPPLRSGSPNPIRFLARLNSIIGSSSTPFFLPHPHSRLACTYSRFIYRRLTSYVCIPSAHHAFPARPQRRCGRRRRISSIYLGYPVSDFSHRDQLQSSTSPLTVSFEFATIGTAAAIFCSVQLQESRVVYVHRVTPIKEIVKNVNNPNRMGKERNKAPSAFNNHNNKVHPSHIYQT